MTARPRRPGSRSGQAIAETGIVLLILLLLGMGIVEFGRMLMVANMITHAAGEGARVAATTPASRRGSDGTILDTSAVRSLVQSQIANVVDGTFAVAVSQPTTDGVPLVTVTVTGAVPYLMVPTLVGTSLTVARSVSFRDEGR